MTKDLFNKTGTLIWFILRRDRLRLLLWIGSLFLITVVVALSYDGLYATEAEQEAIAQTMSNPAMIAMAGQGYGLDNYTTGAMMAHQMLLFTLIAVGIMSILFVIRHTRAEEEDGRMDMIRSLPTGRLSHVSAILLVMIGTYLLLILLIGFGLYMLGIDSIDLNGSFLYGAAVGVTGIIFAALTAVIAQLTQSSRTATGLSLFVLISSYVMRAIGDVGNETLSWFSPLGFVLGAEVFVNNYWWPILFTVIISIIFMVIALYLHAIRDLGAGFFQDKKGRAYASTFLQGPFGLTFKLQRTGLIAWAAGIGLIGVIYGSIFGDLELFLENLEIMEDILPTAEGFSLTEQFLAMLMSLMGMMSTIPALMALLKLIGEEKKNRTEYLLSRAVSRIKLMGSHIILALITSVIMLFLAVLGLWSAGAVVMDEPIGFYKMWGAGIVYLPAIWVMIGIAAMLVGCLPRLTNLVWVYLVYSFIVVYLGELLQFSEWLYHLSPYGLTPQLPIEDMNVTKAIIMISIACMLMMAGLIGYQKRDIEG